MAGHNQKWQDTCHFLATRCKATNKELGMSKKTYHKKYYQEHRAELNAKCLEWKRANRKKVAARQRQYYQANREKELARQRRNYQN